MISDSTDYGAIIKIRLKALNLITFISVRQALGLLIAGLKPCPTQISCQIIFCF
jgi:hypothetical protein